MTHLQGQPLASPHPVRYQTLLHSHDHVHPGFLEDAGAQMTVASPTQAYKICCSHKKHCGIVAKRLLVTPGFFTSESAQSQ